MLSIRVSVCDRARNNESVDFLLHDSQTGKMYELRYSHSTINQWLLNTFVQCYVGELFYLNEDIGYAFLQRTIGQGWKLFIKKEANDHDSL